jgi:hypothetical protein
VISISIASGSAPERHGSPTLPNPRDTTSWQRLLGRTASEYGRLCHGDGGPEGGHRCRRVSRIEGRPHAAPSAPSPREASRRPAASPAAPQPDTGRWAFISRRHSRGRESGARALARTVRRLEEEGEKPVEGVQIFTPTPMTRSTCLYHTGKDPVTGEKVHVPLTYAEKKAQKRMLQPASKTRNSSRPGSTSSR